MEKDFTKEIADPGDDSGKNEKDQECAEIMSRAQMQSLEERIKKAQKQIEMNKRALDYLKRKTSCLQTFSLSPTESLCPESQTFIENELKIYANPGFLAELKQCLNFYDCKDSFTERPKKNGSNSRESFEEKEEAQFDFLCNSSLKTSDNETQAPESNFSTDLDIMKAEDSYRYAGKGKQAANPAFRYKKRSKIASASDYHEKANNSKFANEEISKTNISCKLLAKDSPVKHSEVFDSPKTLDSKIESISPGVKRKGSDSNEKDLGSIISKLSGNLATDDLKISKKLKFKDDENVKRQHPFSTEVSLLENFKSNDLSEFMNKPQIDKTSYEREQIVPSAKNLSNVRQISDIIPKTHPLQVEAKIQCSATEKRHNSRVSSSDESISGNDEPMHF